MAKKKANSKKSIEKDMKNLFDHIGNQEFTKEEDIESFMNQILGKKIEDIIPKKTGKRSREEESSDLVYEAYESTIGEGKKLVKKALELDPNNVDAYNFLGNIEQDIHKATDLYKKGMEVGRKTIGEEAYVAMKGHFWGFHKTRPFMTAKASYADCLSILGRIKECIQQYLELFELNPNDNQGLRYQFADILVYAGEYDEYERLRKRFKDEASTFWAFTYALFLFKKEGDSKKAQKALLEANKSNKHIVPFLIGNREIPENNPEFYGWGDENEAVVYINGAGKMWLETDNALPWVYEFFTKRRRLN